MPLRVCSLAHGGQGTELGQAGSWGLDLAGLGRAGRGRGLGAGQGRDSSAQPGGHLPLADRLTTLEVSRQVTHAVHGLHEFPQVRLDLWGMWQRVPNPPGPLPGPFS